MKFKKALLLSFSLIFLAGSAVTLSACTDEQGATSAQDFYAMAALSSVNYLQMQDAGNLSSTLSQTLAGETRPDSVSEKDVQDLASYMAMFQGMLKNSTEQYFTNSEVDSTDEYYSTYNLKMTFTIPTLEGQKNLVMYYKEIDTTTKEEIDDDEIEQEINTTLEGVLVDGENTYQVEGKREYEKEGNKTEVELEFKTYDQNDPNQYVLIEHEKENAEIEYKYSIFQNGNKISETQVEFENKRNNKSLELEFESHQGELEYEITQQSENVYNVKLKNSSNQQTVVTFTITVTDEGYVFSYSNGFSETV